LFIRVPTTQFLCSVSLLETNIFHFLTIHYSERKKIFPNTYNKSRIFTLSFIT
jgi:hypothetical protein